MPCGRRLCRSSPSQLVWAGRSASRRAQGPRCCSARRRAWMSAPRCSSPGRSSPCGSGPPAPVLQSRSIGPESPGSRRSVAGPASLSCAVSASQPCWCLRARPCERGRGCPPRPRSKA
eukprot:scaffold88567_cov61-Phaeocystis_antarctica.AAC.4